MNIPSPEELRTVSEALGFELPASYVEFCKRGGLGQTGFRNRILRPDEILSFRTEVPTDLVPFADDGCGDLFCWTLDDTTEPAVLFYEQETQRSSQVAPSFAEWLPQNRL